MPTHDDDIDDLVGDGPEPKKRKANTSDGKPRPNADPSQTVAAGQLRAIIERIERMEEEKKTIADDIKEIYSEAKGNGFDTKAIRQIIRDRKKDQAEREEFESIVDLYKAALGMI